MLILGFETSCDETSVALVEDGKKILSLYTAGQEIYHQAFGGVVPEIAARRHLELLLPTLDKALSQGLSTAPQTEGDKIRFIHDSVDAIAVTSHPGLMGSLLTGVQTAKTLAYLMQKPLIAVSHLRAHFYSILMAEAIISQSAEAITSQSAEAITSQSKEAPPPFSSPHPFEPLMALLVSGGHTLLAEIRSPLEIDILGSTLDDACGECFDKIARALGLPYPGGAPLEKLAATGNPQALAYPMFKSKDPRAPYAMSFSGLKTAVLYQSNSISSKFPSHKHPNSAYPPAPAPTSPQQKFPGHKTPRLDKFTPTEKADIAASFQEAIFTQLCDRLVSAARKRGINRLGICGGVAANAALQAKLRQTWQASEPNSHTPLTLIVPPIELCTDNAAMVAGLAYHQYCMGELSQTPLSLEPSPSAYRKQNVL